WQRPLRVFRYPAWAHGRSPITPLLPPRRGRRRDTAALLRPVRLRGPPTRAHPAPAAAPPPEPPPGPAAAPARRQAPRPPPCRRLPCLVPRPPPPRPDPPLFIVQLILWSATGLLLLEGDFLQSIAHRSTSR